MKEESKYNFVILIVFAAAVAFMLKSFLDFIATY